jgi:MFS family permease
MFSVIKLAWPLFLGVSLIMLGNGLQGSLLGIRAVQEGFSTSATGIVMSGYFAGFLFGSLMTPRLVKSVGHVRVFAALASLASTAVLLHVVFINPANWTAMRLLTGFSYAGLYVVAESWINDRATKETRAQLLAFYMIIVLGGMAAGQPLLNLSDIGGADLFILSSVLISMALLPILLTSGSAPAFEAPQAVGLLELYRLSPLGTVSALGTGMIHGSLIGMGAVYAETIGLSVVGISIFMGTLFLGGLVCQWPIGRISDRFDRRKVLTAVTILASLFALGGASAATLPPLAVYATVALFGGMSLPLYSLAVAHTNDHLSPAQMVGASSTLYIYVGVGAATGPIISAFLMEQAGPSSYSLFMGAVLALVAAFALYRMTQRETNPLDEQGPAVAVVSTASSLATALTLHSVRDQMDADPAAKSHARMRDR